MTTAASASPSLRQASSPPGNIRRYIKSILNRLDSNPYQNLQQQSLAAKGLDENEDIVSYLIKVDNRTGKAKEFTSSLSKAQKFEFRNPKLISSKNRKIRSISNKNSISGHEKQQGLVEIISGQRPEKLTEEDSHSIQSPPLFPPIKQVQVLIQNNQSNFPLSDETQVQLQSTNLQKPIKQKTIRLEISDNDLQERTDRQREQKFDDNDLQERRDRQREQRVVVKSNLNEMIELRRRRYEHRPNINSFKTLQINSTKSQQFFTYRGSPSQKEVKLNLKHDDLLGLGQVPEKFPNILIPSYNSDLKSRNSKSTDKKKSASVTLQQQRDKQVHQEYSQYQTEYSILRHQPQVKSVEKFAYGIIFDERDQYADQYLGTYKNLPKKFKRTQLAKFGMNKLSLNPIAPDLQGLDMDDRAKNREFQFGKKKYVQMEEQIQRLQSKTRGISLQEKSGSPSPLSENQISYSRCSTACNSLMFPSSNKKRKAQSKLHFKKQPSPFIEWEDGAQHPYSSNQQQTKAIPKKLRQLKVKMPGKDEGVHNKFFLQNKNMNMLILKATEERSSPSNTTRKSLKIPNFFESIQNTNIFDLTFAEKTKAWTINEARSITDLTQRESYRIYKGLSVKNNSSSNI